MWQLFESEEYRMSIGHWYQLQMKPAALREEGPAVHDMSALVPTVEVTIEQNLFRMMRPVAWKNVIAELPEWVRTVSIWSNDGLVRFRVVEDSMRRDFNISCTRELIRNQMVSAGFPERLGRYLAMSLNAERFRRDREHRPDSQTHSTAYTGYENLTMESVEAAVRFTQGPWRCKRCNGEFSNEEDVWTNPDKHWDRYDCFCHPCYLAVVRGLEERTKALAERVKQL